MKFVQLAKSLKEGLSPVYLIEGEETYFRDSAVDMIRRACGIGNPMLNDARYEGDAFKGEAIASLVRALGTLPFLDERRLVRACEFYPTEKEWDTYLKDYCARPCPSTVFLIVNSAKKANAAQLSRKGGVTFVDCSREDEETLSRWLFGDGCGRGAASGALLCAGRRPNAVRDRKTRIRPRGKRTRDARGGGGIRRQRRGI